MHWLVRCSDETVCSLCRDELMAKVGGGMEEDAGRGGDPSIGRRRHGLKSRRRHGPKSLDMRMFYCLQNV